MRIVSQNRPENAVSIDTFLREGEYDQGDVALISYDDLYDYLDAIRKALDKADAAIGNERETYTLAQRVLWLATVKDTLIRQVDELRAQQKARFVK